MSFTVLWVAWLAVFAVVEAAALAKHRKGGTLSEHVWGWFCLRRGGPWCTLRRILFASFWLWLTLHFATGGRWP